MTMIRILCTCTALLYPLLLNSSCTSTSKYYPVTDIAPRQNSHGFSIVPPPGTGWYEKHKGDSLLYLKKTGDKDHLMYMKATEINIDPTSYSSVGFKEYVRTLKRSPLPKDRYKNITFRIDSYNALSPHCAKYHYTYEDHGEKKQQHLSHIKVENRGLVCMHPNSPDIGIDMFYIERARENANLVSYQKEGNQFLNSLKFDTHH